MARWGRTEGQTVALTMTRTRTQTTLTKLATMVAGIHRELAFVELLLEDASAEVSLVGGLR